MKCRLLIPILSLSTAAATVASPIAHWQYDGSITADSITTDGSQDDVVLNGADSGNIMTSTDLPGAIIFDPISGGTRANTASVSMFGDRTNTGGTIDDNGVSRLQTTGTDLQASDASFTFETFVKFTSLNINNGSLAFAGQYSNTGTPGGFNQGWNLQFRPNDATPDTNIFVDLADENNDNDANLNGPWTSGNPTDGQWHHFAVVYDQDNGNFEMFLDYQSVAATTIDTSTAAFARPHQLLFGVRFITNPATDTSSSVGLLLDETRYSNSALNSNEFLRAIPEPSSFALVLIGFIGLRLGRKLVR